MDGIELNRPDVREKFSINTKFRPLTAGYMMHNGNFIAEHEEVVVSSKTFSYDDFMEVRCLNFMFYLVFILNFLFKNSSSLSGVMLISHMFIKLSDSDFSR